MNKRKRDTTRADLIEVMETIHDMENKDMVEYVMRFFSQSISFETPININVTVFKHFLFTKERVIMYQTIQKAKMFDMISEDKVEATLKDMKAMAEEAFGISQLTGLQETLKKKTQGYDIWSVVLDYIVDQNFLHGPVTFEQLIDLQGNYDEDKVSAWSKTIDEQMVGLDLKTLFD